jgi:hypothetical protein
MTRRLLTALAVLFAISLAAPNIGHAQTFKVEKFDIKGEGGTDYVAVEAATGRVFVSRSSHPLARRHRRRADVVAAVHRVRSSLRGLS